jgi:hypothetical protein
VGQVDLPRNRSAEEACRGRVFLRRKSRVTRHPIAPGWPLETLSTTTFAENGGKTTITLEWRAVNATKEERDLFDSSHDNMTGGWTGTMDALDGYLKTLR